MKTSILCVLLLLAGCAKPPGEIAASAVPTDPYMQMSCESLVSERAAKQAELDRLSGQQEETAKRDEAWMAIVHVPVASMSKGDHEPEIATLKGQVNAITQASQSKSCG
jgi:starvation-inducible outer membrane lipoprotein